MNTIYFKNLAIGNLFHAPDIAPLPKPYYLGLSSTAPNEKGENITEPSFIGTGYSRAAIMLVSSPEDGIVTNTVAITFPESLLDWFTEKSPATHYVIFDSKSGGNALMYNSLTKPKVIKANTVPTITPFSLHLQITD